MLLRIVNVSQDMLALKLPIMLVESCQLMLQLNVLLVLFRTHMVEVYAKNVLLGTFVEQQVSLLLQDHVLQATIVQAEHQLQM